MSRHLALFAPSMRGGGAERNLATVANGLARRGWRIDLVLASAEGPYLKEIDSAVRIIDLGAPRVLRALLPLRRYVLREKPDVVLSTIASANSVALLVSLLVGGSMRLVLREANTPSALAGSSTSLRQRLIPSLIRLLRGRIARIVAVSAGSADDLAACYGVERSRIEVIPNPVITARLQELAAQTPDHPWLNDADLQVIVAVGRLAPQKNYRLLLEAFAKLEDPAGRRLVILGEGPQRAELENLAQELGVAGRVDLPGFVDNPFAFLSAADAFVLSSDYEGLPASLIQALACGCPTVSTDCPSGPAEILQDGSCGLLVPVGDRAALTRAIAEVLTGRAPAPDSAHLQRYAEENAVARYEQVVLDVAGQGRGPLAEAGEDR